MGRTAAAGALLASGLELANIWGRKLEIFFTK